MYIKVTPDPGYTALGVPISVKKTINSDNIQAPRRTPDITDEIPVSAVQGKLDVYQFTMPADGSDVVVSMAFPDKDYETKVKYLKWNDTDEKLEETTTDDNTKVYILDGTETELDTWLLM